MSATIGSSASKEFIVGEGDTAVALGSGDVPVLGTPRLIAWCEEVTVLALTPELQAGQTSVGYQIRVDHLAPTPVGGAVAVQASIAEVDGRQVGFEILAADGNGDVARGTITRVLVDRERFIAKATG
ncbi:MAG: thioesterase family protein [Acidimicrobiales bacterium]